MILDAGSEPMKVKALLARLAERGLSPTNLIRKTSKYDGFTVLLCLYSLL